MKKILLLLITITFGAISYAQEITGVVLDQNGIPLPGVNIQALTSKTFTATDFDGNFVITAKSGEDLEFTMVGMKTLVQKATKEKMKVVMQEEVNALDEVVVIGYGSQKKADLTGAITSVDSQAISKTPSSNVTSSLQGKIAGIQVTNTGVPGGSSDIKLRGVGTYVGGTNPLYVVDGMFYDNVDFLNPNDVKSINILKDASSTAIYGVKGSGGVIIIETKSGAYEKEPEVSYDGYTGTQIPQNVLKMANAEQFVTMAYESGSQADVDAVLKAMQLYGRSRVNPNVPDVNTDWYKQLLHPAIITNHNLNFSGGGSNVTYSVGTSYFNQDGLLKIANDNYERFNIRSKIEGKLSDRAKIGANLIFSNATQFLAENSVWNLAYFAVPILPVYDENNTYATPEPYANAKDMGYRSTQNPYPLLSFYNNRIKKRSILGSLYAEYFLIPQKLAFKTSYSGSYRPQEGRKVQMPYTLGIDASTISSLNIKNESWFDNIWDNTLTYTNSFGAHSLTLLGGTSFRDEAYNWYTGYGSELANPFDENTWYLEQTAVESRTSSSGAKRFYAIGYFGRAQYNFKDKYLVNLSLRAEGNSKYTKKPWGYFPGVGLGWVVSSENFMDGNNLFDFLKLRASWGRNGNDKVPFSAGSNEISNVNLAILDTQTTGTIVTSTYADYEWELVEETNVGLSARMFANKLSLEADYYIRDTKNAVIPVYQPIISLYIGQNAGVLRNSGLEVALNWNNRVHDNLNYNFGVNFATLHNEVVDIFNQEYIDGGTAEFRQRSIVGEPIAAFFGYEVAGVYQNWDEINADPIAVANDLQPGYFKYVDQNKDGLLTADDRVVLGSYLPSFTYGGNLGINYHNWDFSVSLYGQTGNKILNRKRGEVIWTSDQNMDADLAINRWHGEGTSDSYPSSAALRDGWNQKMSDFFVEDGSYFRIQNIQLGYNIKGLKFFNSMPDARITLTAERPITLFKYNGFNPEVSNSDFQGWDTQTYPVPAVYTVGFNFKF